ncbi:thiaminase II [Kiloniella sp. b19]|uniref:thiaminase II n=1 Tax=Kiloniella sp. GXU_MW_B19 TaxID=3141326 RepID=UPI0031DE5903
MANQPDYGTVFGHWRKACGSVWTDYTHHAFVEGMRDGTLPRAAFLHYLKQDYIFLIHFSRAWALAAAKSETLEEMKIAAGTVNALVNEELQLHIETCAREGISETDIMATSEATANLAYTRYVLEAGYSGDFLDLMAALASCVLGYGEIGLRLKETGSSDAYQEWIDTYSGPEYQDACQAVGALLDSAVLNRLGKDYLKAPRWTALSRRFDKATELEVGFWEMGLNP